MSETNHGNEGQRFSTTMRKSLREIGGKQVITRRELTPAGQVQYGAGGL